MLVYAVDLGTTNTKVVLYDELLRRLAIAASPAVYERAGTRVEFDADALFEVVIGLVAECAAAAGTGAAEDAVIALTGQAESLVLLDRSGKQVVPAQSWLDERADHDAEVLGEHFGTARAFEVTGQPAPSAAWPASKLHRLHRTDPTVLEQTATIAMVKDHVVGRLTGTFLGEETTRGFSYMWDVRARQWWPEMLDVCGVDARTLAAVVPAGSDVGPVQPSVRERLPRARSWRVNIGALDHFAAMVGTASYRPGVVSESAGTVLSLSVLVRGGRTGADGRVSFHNGLLPGDTVLFNGVDSGGVALEWFRRTLSGAASYAELEQRLAARPRGRSAPVFLPYLTGVNPPDYFAGARGAFLGLDLGHDAVDLAHSVQEGIAHLLRRNVDAMALGSPSEIVSTGGGAASPTWNQLKADVCDVDVVVPDEREATCRGVAVLALVAAGLRSGPDDVDADLPSKRRFRARHDDDHERRYALFEDGIARLFTN